MPQIHLLFLFQRDIKNNFLVLFFREYDIQKQWRVPHLFHLTQVLPLYIEYIYIKS